VTMLTKKDLQAISELMDSKFDEKFAKELRPIWKKLRKLRSDLKATINFFDSEVLHHDKRLIRIENHLNLPLLQ